MATCTVGGCREQHGLLEGVCYLHLRWRDLFSARELDDLLAVLSSPDVAPGSPQKMRLTILHNQIWAMRQEASS